MADPPLGRQPVQLQQRQSTAPSVRLSCEMCRQRKVRCDKLTPCTNCQRLGAVCVPVQRPRLPRGRVRRAAESPSESGATLKDRVVRVEQLLEELLSRNKGIDVSSHEPQSRDGIDQESESEARRAVVGPPATNRNVFPQKPEMYLGSTFWEDLLHQVSGHFSVRAAWTISDFCNRLEMYKMSRTALQRARGLHWGPLPIMARLCWAALALITFLALWLQSRRCGSSCVKYSWIGWIPSSRFFTDHPFVNSCKKVNPT